MTREFLDQAVPRREQAPAAEERDREERERRERRQREELEAEARRERQAGIEAEQVVLAAEAEELERRIEAMLSRDSEDFVISFIQTEGQ